MWGVVVSRPLAISVPSRRGSPHPISTTFGRSERFKGCSGGDGEQEGSFYSRNAWGHCLGCQEKEHVDQHLSGYCLLTGFLRFDEVANIWLCDL